MGIHDNGQFEQPLPDLVQQNINKVVEFQNACYDLCSKILESFAIALEIDKDWFTSRHDLTKGPTGSVFRLLYYPAALKTQDEVDIRAGAHSDYGSITCLFQLPGQPGLEIKTPSGEWMAVPVDPLGSGKIEELPILVNIGDLLEDWTAGLLKSTVHRVVFPKDDGGDRYSIGKSRKSAGDVLAIVRRTDCLVTAYFCHPLDEANLEPVPSKAVEERAKLHGGKKAASGARIITAKDHLVERLAATYSV